MLQLAFDLSGPVISVALFEQAKLLAAVKSQGQKQHAETLFPYIEQVLKMAGKKKSELELISVCTGPGSFTGIRMAISAAKVMAWALQIPLCAASSLEVMHETYRAAAPFRLALIDARGSRVYASLYANNTLYLPEDKYELSEIIACLAKLKQENTAQANSTQQASTEVLVFGDGVSKLLAEEVGEFNLRSVDPSPGAISAEKLALIGQRAAAKGEFIEPLALAANYCSLSQAERLRIEAEKKRQTEAASLAQSEQEES
ncbi:MAG: tRNA (adenosine(37)-N6)-threonylcarbamoyltransferase complex dimerization subunit type 1 TsaB [Eubacteriales bacterium]|nr:tRNA (adenosine(37)-N6)-threonylcarbamoyltransferase complex dimerization subunit type 1 TsaB [Eubacteriales bacterium]